jgi:hypothetical protein
MLIKNMVYHAQLCSASSLHLTSILPNIKPILANINLSENCNARCQTCDYWKDKHTDDIDTNRAIMLLQELR